MDKFSVILAAAGKSSRFADPNHKKPYVELHQKAVWLHSAERFLNRDDVRQVIIVIAEEDKELFLLRFGSEVTSRGIEVVLGGAERADSVQNALGQVDEECDFVAIHDAARPCINDDDIERVFAAARESGAAILATPVSSTVKKSIDGISVDSTVDRSELWLAQTPQCFSRTLIQNAYGERGELTPTDEAQLVELRGEEVRIVEGSPLNIKLTTKTDLAFAEACIATQKPLQVDTPPDDRLLR